MSGIARSSILHTVPEKKLLAAIENTLKNCETCSKSGVKIGEGICNICSIKNKAIQRYFDSNIPSKYWGLYMRDYKGDPVLLELYKKLTADIKKTYLEGKCYSFCGTFGVGKTYLIANLLKKYSEASFDCIYVNLSDLVNLVTANNSEDKGVARRELLLCDFLAIDEFDGRYISSDKSSDFFGKSFEEIFRNRCQNGLATYLCSNTINMLDSFNGSIKQALGSLSNYIETVCVIGQDYRKIENK